MKTPIVCPKCKSKRLNIFELAEGAFYNWTFDKNGDFGVGYMGNISGTSKYCGECLDCKYIWKIKKKINLEYPTKD